MSFTVNNKTNLYVSKNALKGVKRIVNYIKDDLHKVFSYEPEIIDDVTKIKGNTIIIGTIGYDDFIDKYDTDVIRGRNEVYLFKNDSDNLIIIGSDKRGTIYGLFHLSELIGVSPFVNWADVLPVKKEEVMITDNDNIISKEPSVTYRGFFINDEWPAFGNWSEKRFGGFNAECYERVFELLLRLKGNYLWPAMWSAQFNLDGPDLLNAELADEMGVIMGMSHHEPCCRNGEEYRYVRGPKSIYGDDWNFVRNREGIIKFWEDGLLRNAKFENVITVGMRGEADSTILGHEATLKDNIDYLKDVLETQNKLIKDIVNEDLDKVPRMLALYKEVEPFFYGDENTKGLKDSPLLDGTTLMLCDDNFGNLRTIPDESMKNHKGGYGMYYHFDYHGSPISYEWINSSHIAKAHQEMSKAYDNDIRKLWIVNVGDVFTNEFPLSFFLEMAYDYDKWGSSNKNAANEYTKLFVERLFPSFSEVEKEVTIEILDGYTKIAHNYRPEAINAKRLLENRRMDDLDKLFNEVSKLMYNCQMLYDGVSKINKFPFFEFVYYPAMGYLNVLKMWLYTAYNNYLASIGAVKANELSKEIFDCVEFDRKLIEELHTIHDGFWYGMGMSEHIGFKHWNEEECQYPVIKQVIASNKNRIVVAVPGRYEHTEGGDWTKKTIDLYTDTEATVEIFSTAYKDSYYDVEVLDDFIIPSKTSSVISSTGVDFVTFYVDKDKRKDNAKGTVIIHGDYGHTKLVIHPSNENPVRVLNDYDEEFKDEYKVEVPNEGEYEISVFLSPSNPPFKDNKLFYRLNVNGNDIMVNAVSDDFAVGDGQVEWYDGVLNNIRISNTKVKLMEGINSIKLSPESIGVVFKKLVLKKI